MIHAGTGSIKKSIHVLTDPNFAYSVLCHWLVFVSVIAIVAGIPVLRETAQDVYFRLNEWMLAIAHQYAWWSLLVLLSSSCCALQLILNCLSMGCAGFNSILGPLRPIFLSLTILVQMGTWYVAWSRPWQWVPTGVSTVIVLSISFLPDLLSLYTILMSAKRAHDGEIPSEEIKSSSKVLVLKMTSVGCSACLVTVTSILKAIVGLNTLMLP